MTHRTTEHDDREGHFLHCLMTLYDAVNENDAEKQHRAMWMLNMQAQGGPTASMVAKMREQAKADYDSFWERADGR